MKHPANKPPLSIWIAAVLVAGESLVRFLLSPIGVVGAVLLGFEILLSYLLLTGSRVAWTLLAIGMGLQLFSPFMGQPIWVAVPGGIALGCLLVKPSLRFVWARASARSSDSPRSAVRDWYEKVQEVPYKVTGLSHVLSIRIKDATGRRSYRKLIIQLAICTVALFLLVGAVRLWYLGAGKGSLFVYALLEIARIGSGLSQVALVIILILAAHNYLVNRKEENDRFAQ